MTRLAIQMIAVRPTSSQQSIDENGQVGLSTIGGSALWSPNSPATNGQLVYGPQLPFAQPEGEGDSGDNSWPDIPVIPAPQLQFTLNGTDPDDFIPYSLSSFSSTVGSLGSWAQGTNWIHEVAIQWTSEATWPFTEQLSMTYSVTEIQSDNGLLEDIDDPEDPEGLGQNNNDDGLVVEGDWSSNVSMLRVGYVFLTFQASRNNVSTGSLFIVGGGTTWSINVTFLEVVQAVVNASMSSSVHADPATTSGGSSPSNPFPGGGEGSDIEIPNDFTGSASWSANIVSVQAVLGHLNMSSIPFIHGGSTPATVIVDRFIIDDGSVSRGCRFDWHPARRRGCLVGHCRAEFER